MTTSSAPTVRHSYEIAIIGSGSGNTIPDERFAHLKIAMIDGGKFGGTCLNNGCVPTKMFVYPADVLTEMAELSPLNITAQPAAIQWKDIQERVLGRVGGVSESGKKYRDQDCPNIDLYIGQAHFEGKDTHYNLAIDTQEGRTHISARKVIIAAGSRPIIPEVIEQSQVQYYTNENIMSVVEIPKRLIILGSGYIAAEFAHIFSAFGSQVHVVTRSNIFLKNFDHTIATDFTAKAQQRWKTHFGVTISSAETLPDQSIAVTLSDGQIIEGDVLLIAAGRRPNGDLLQLSSIGIQLNSSGSIDVDQYQRTDAHNVYALGDVCSPYQLKHVANREARTVQFNVLQKFEDRTHLQVTDHRAIPSAVFTHPQIATVGYSENQARHRGYSIAVSTHYYRDVAYGWAMGDAFGVCKIIADRVRGHILGAHIMGAQASTLLQTLITAMTFKISVHDLAHEQYWIHPALPEVIENALLKLKVHD